MNSFSDFLGESFDKTLPLLRDIPPIMYVADQWEFEMNSQTHIVRFERGGERFGKRAMEVRFGRKMGRKLSPTISGIGNIREYMGTVLKAMENAIDDPTKKTEMSNHGFVLIIPTKVFEKFGARLIWILRRKMRGKYNISDYTGYPESYGGNFSAIYMYKLGKRFNGVFHNLPVEVEEPVELPPLPVKKTPIKSPVISEPEAEPDPWTGSDDIPTPSMNMAGKMPIKSPVIIAAPVASKKAAIKATPSIHEIYGNELEEKAKEAYWKMVWTIDFDEANRDSYGLKHDPEIVVLSSYYKKKNPNAKYSNKKLVFLFNVFGVKNKYTGVAWQDDYTQSLGLSTVLPIMKPIKEQPWPYIYDILVNWENYFMEIMKKLNKPETFTVKYDTPSILNRVIVPKINTAEDGKKLISQIIQTLPEKFHDDLPKEEIFEMRKSGHDTKKEKLVKTLKYASQHGYPHELDEAITATVRLMDTPQEILDFIDTLPNYINHQHTLLSADYEIFEAEWISLWLLSGGTRAHVLSSHGAANTTTNTLLESNSYWIHQKQGTLFKTYTLEDLTYKQPRFTGHFNTMYNKTQEFYRQKLGKKYDGYKFKLYRGIGTYPTHKYIPSTIESWSLELSTAVRFAKMMAKQGAGTVLYAEVPVTGVIGSYEALDEVFLSDADLKGKKEIMVMGGAFAEVPIYEFNVDGKTPVDKISSFKEFTMMEQVFKENKKQIKIVKPSQKDANTGLGYDPNEDLTKADPKP